MEYLPGWSVVRCTKNDISDVVSDSVKKEIIFTFGPPKKITSDSEKCYTANTIQDIMTHYGIKRKKVCSYASMSNGRVERMVGSIK